MRMISGRFLSKPYFYCMDLTLKKIGRLNKTFGLKGHIRAFIEPAMIARLKKLDTIYLLIKNKPLPYFVDESDLTSSGHCMLHFDEIKDKTAADQLIGKEIFVEEKSLKKIKPYSSIGDYIGFKLIDENIGEIGILEDTMELPNHEVGQFIYEGQEILFPWNDEVILRIDKRKKEILLRLPEGLFEIYLRKNEKRKEG